MSENTLRSKKISLSKSLREKINEKKVIPKNIQLAIDKYLAANDYDNIEPKKVKLDSYADFDSIKHENDYILFKPGGEVGDKEWKLQYMHNMCVLLKYQRQKNKEVFFAPETLIPVDNKKELKTIDIMIDDLLIDRIDYMWSTIADHMYEIKPPVKNPENLRFVHLNYLFEDDNGYTTPDLTKRIKIVLNYSNEKQVLTKDDIVIARY